MAKKSVHLTAQTEMYISQRTHHSEQPNWSAAINAAFEQLSFLAKASLPDNLLSDDWTEIRNIYAGSDLTRICLPINIARDLLDHYGATVPKQLPENTQKLVDKLADYTQAQQYSILDYTRIFWARSDLE